MEDKQIGDFIIKDDGIYRVDSITTNWNDEVGGLHSRTTSLVSKVMSKEAFQEAYKRFISLDNSMTVYKLF